MKSELLLEEDKHDFARLEATTKSIAVSIMWTSLPSAIISPGLDLSDLRWGGSIIRKGLTIMFVCLSVCPRLLTPQKMSRAELRSELRSELLSEVPYYILRYRYRKSTVPYGTVLYRTVCVHQITNPVLYGTVRYRTGTGTVLYRTVCVHYSLPPLVCVHYSLPPPLLFTIAFLLWFCNSIAFTVCVHQITNTVLYGTVRYRTVPY